MVKIPKQTLIPIAALKPYGKNVKIHSKEQIEDLAKLMDLVGFKDPIVLDDNNTIWAGHGRLEAARLRKMTKVPVIYLKDLSEDQKKWFMLADNKINESPWNAENVQLVLEDIPQFILEEYHMNFDDVIQLKLKDEIEPIPEPPKEPKTKLGDIYELGRHRLICGDALVDIEKIIKLLDVDFVFTDPPYNIGFNYHGHEDKMTDKEYFDFCQAWYGIIHEIPNIVITPGPRNLGLWYNIDSEITDIGVWREPNSQSGATVFNFRTCEPILFYGKFKKKRVFDYFEHNAAFTKDLTSALKETGTLNVHPPSKPLSFVSDILEAFTVKDCTVLDIFLGGGTTLIACEQTSRICYGVEIDPAYCDVIVKRWENFTGEKAKKI